MRRPLRWLGGIGAAACVAAGWVWGPTALRGIEWFDVRTVEVSGTRLLAPHEVLAVAGIARGQSLWDDREMWERPLREHPAIASARVTRRLPGTLRVRVEEKHPVAYVEAGTLRLATADGELLPVEPTRRPVDLPIVRAEWGDSAQGTVARGLLALAGRLEALDPGLLGSVSEIRATRRGVGGAVLVHPLGEIVVPADADAERLAELRAVIADLERRAAADRLGAPSGVRVDLRYDDQVVVRFPSSV